MHAIIQNATTRMHKCVEAFKTETSKLRTGRAHPSILDHVRVDYYGSLVPISQVASVVATDARTITITPWEKNFGGVIEKAIHNSDLGLNPANAGDVIRVPMPALNEERRKELIKVVRSEAENARVSVRNVRRDANNEFKALLKNKELTEDEERRLVDEVQKMTDKVIVEIDQLTTQKEADLMVI